MISFGQMPQRNGGWTWLKPLISSKSLMLQYEEDNNSYLIYGYDVPEVLFCTIWKGSVPASAISGGYSQAQNDADKSDFETNFAPYANRSVDDIPSKIITSPLKNGAVANFGVNGAVTPVAFEYSPPSNFDIEIYQFSFLIEDAAAISFGNKFVLTTLSPLANGLLLECKAADLSFTWQNMKRTRDLIEISKDFSIITGSVNFLRVNVQLPASLRLARAGTYAQPDFLRVTVRDDLSAITFAEAHFQGVKI